MLGRRLFLCCFTSFHLRFAVHSPHSKTARHGRHLEELKRGAQIGKRSLVGVLGEPDMASRLMRSIAHASSAPNIALVDAVSLTWLLLMLLAMAVLELLSSRGSGAPGRGRLPGAVAARHFLPAAPRLDVGVHRRPRRQELPSEPVRASSSSDQMRSYALFLGSPSCTAQTFSSPSSYSSRPWLFSGAAHSAVRAMVPPIFPCGTVRAHRAAQCPFSSARRFGCRWCIAAITGNGDGSRWFELVGPPRNGHEPRALARRLSP